MTHGLFPHLLLLSAFCGASLSCSSPSRDITIRSIPSGASLRVNGDYAGQAPVTLSLNRHKPVHVAADKPGFLSTEKTFHPEMTTQGAILWGRNNEKSKDFKTDILTIRLKKADSGAPPLRNFPRSGNSLPDTFRQGKRLFIPRPVRRPVPHASFMDGSNKPASFFEAAR